MAAGERHQITEIVLGLGAVLVAAMALMLLVIGGQGDETSAMLDAQTHEYRVVARFGDVGGLSAGAPVRIAGVTVGRVTAISIDSVSLAVMVEVGLSGRHALPTDSKITVASGGIFGGKFVVIEPGVANDAIVPGGYLEHVKNYKSLEEQVAEVAFGSGL